MGKEKEGTLNSQTPSLSTNPKSFSERLKIFWLKVQIQGLMDTEEQDTAENLAIRTGVPIRSLYRMDNEPLEAFLDPHKENRAYVHIWIQCIRSAERQVKKRKELKIKLDELCN